MSTTSPTPPPETEAPRRACPAPADFRKEAEWFDLHATVGTWQGPRHRMTYRILGDGPPLIVCPGIASTYRGFCLTLRRLSERFQVAILDYPGENPDDGASLGAISHDGLVDDLFGLIEHLNYGRVFLFGPSFGSTIVLQAMAREPRRFPKAVIQGAFAHRPLAPSERLALRLGRLFPGKVKSLPLQARILEMNHRTEFPTILDERWAYYVEQNGLTPIAPLATRLDLLGKLDLRPILPKITGEVLVLQGNEDRLVPRRHYDDLLADLPNARGIIMPLVGHQPHFTHAEALADAIGEFLLPCAPGGCPNDPPPPP